jgi:hypothetical protein
MMNLVKTEENSLSFHLYSRPVSHAKLILTLYISAKSGWFAEIFVWHKKLSLNSFHLKNTIELDTQ